MTVIILEGVPPRLRGALTRWLLEVRPHVYVGTVSSRVRDKLWARAVKACVDGSVVMIWSSRSEQGFDIRTHGNPSYLPRDFEGLLLVTRPGRGISKLPIAGSDTAKAPDNNLLR